MKSEELKQKALALYISNVSKEQIAKETGVSHKTIQKWQDKFNWREIREKAINENLQKAPEKFQEIVSKQIEIGKLAHDELIRRLEKGLIKYDSDLIQIMKHVLEIIRPKAVSQYNFVKQDNNNLNIEINIPEKVKELLNELNRETSVSLPVADGE